MQSSTGYHGLGVDLGCTALRDNADETRRDESPGWKPPTLSRVVFVSIIVLTVALILALGLLLWQNTLHGGIIFAEIQEGFSDLQLFLFRYFPVVIMVLYGVFWGWLDLDIKRLEPYYQLARLDGVSGHDSLLLQYPSTFFALVPFRSAKARHWTVFAISTVTLIVNWAAIPLQNGIFRTTIVNTTDTIQITQPFNLTSVKDQNERMSANFLYDTSSILWLGQQLPNFTSLEYSLAPVQIAPTTTGSNRTVSITTTLYDMDLLCEPPANITIDQDSFIFNDGAGCDTKWLMPAIPSTPTKFEAYFVANTHGVAGDPRFDYSLLDEACPDTHKILVAWMRTGQFQANFADPNNATALFCHTSYFSQEVDAVITIPENKVVSVERKSNRKPLLDSQFNRTRFEYIIAIGGQPFGEERFDMEFERLDQGPFISNMSIMAHIQTMTGLAVGSTHYEPEAYLNATNLAYAYQSAYRLAFALAARYLFDTPAGARISTVPTSASFQAVTMVPVFVVLALITLLTITAFSVFLLIKVPKRSSRLKHDPSCIAENMLLARDPIVRKTIADLFEQSEKAPDLGGSKFTLSRNGLSGEPLLSMTHSSEVLPAATATNIMPNTNSAITTAEDSQTRNTIEPMEYQWYIGAGFILLITLFIAMLVTLYLKSEAQNGLKLPSSNALAIQILTNVLPTLLASSLEPIWVWLARMASILAPVENLQGGFEPARRSLLLTYAAIPPQLVAWQALKKRNFTLGLVSCVALTAGILTVAVSGIFVISPGVSATPITLPQLYSGQVNQVSGFLDVDQNDREFWVVLPNITGHASLPTWTAPHQFFMPLDLSGAKDVGDASVLSMSAPGYSVDTQCTELVQSTTANNTYQLSLQPNSNGMILSTSHVAADGTKFKCAPTFMNLASSPLDGALIDQYNVTGDRQGAKVLSLGHILKQQTAAVNSTSGERFRVDTGQQNGLCQRMFLFGRIRTIVASVPGVANGSRVGNVSKIDVSSTLAVCKPVVVTRMFNISITTAGQVLSTTPWNEQAHPPPASINFTSIVDAIISRFDRGSISYINGTSPQTLFDFLQNQMTNSLSFLDPNQPYPPMTNQTAMASDLFTRMFVVGLRLATQRFAPAPPTAVSVPAQILSAEHRIFISPISFQISITTLALQLLTAIIYFTTRPQPFLKRLPTNLAAQISLFANSHIVDDVMYEAQGDFKELDQRGWKYGYGKFVGLNGKPDEGIERTPYVTPLGKRLSGFQISWAGLRKRTSSWQKTKFSPRDSP